AKAADHRVVAAATVQRSVAAQAREGVVIAIAGEDVGARVAGAVDRRAAGQGQVLEIGAEGEGDRAVHRVGASGGSLDRLVAAIVDDVFVIAGAAVHRVGAAAAV